MSYAITDRMLEEAIGSLPEELDSHDVIFHVMRHHPREYTMDLYSHVSAQDPITTCHAAIGKRLAGMDVLEKTSRQSSTTVRRTLGENQGWHKVRRP